MFYVLALLLLLKLDRGVVDVCRSFVLCSVRYQARERFVLREPRLRAHKVTNNRLL
jgi:hypothetical protein